MPDDTARTAAIPIDQWPDPVCRYGIEDGTPVVRALNAAFERRFGATPPGRPVADALDELTVDADEGPVPEPLAALIGEDEPAIHDADTGSLPAGDWPVDVGGERYSLRAVPDEAGDGGFLVFVAARPDRDVGEPATQIDLDHVASVVSHDLRNPLDVARARLRAGRDDADNEHFEHVARAHDRMERIVQDVLTLAQGEDVVDPDEAVDLDAVARAAWETVETGDADLVVRESLPTALADADRVGRLFENLFRNAVEHGDSGDAAGDGNGDAAGDRDGDAAGDRDGDADDGAEGPTVTVGRLDGDGDSAPGFYVADDGPGIPPDRRDRVFEPGYSTEPHGTGLGLAIVARIAALHDWSIAVETAETGGTRVAIRGLDSP